MKTLLSIAYLLFCLNSFGAWYPNVMTTNPPAQMTNAFSAMLGDGKTVTNITADNNITATNFVLKAPRWIDIPMNYGYSTLGPSAPSLTSVGGGSVIQELAFDNGDILYAQAQLPHTIASTNVLFPRQYIEPHVHWSTVGTLDATHSNVTWRIEWELGSINETYSSGTLTVTQGVTNNFVHYMTELGHITNDPPKGISAVFRCRLMRPASALRDYSNAHDVLLDGFDLHTPIGNTNAIGSRLDNEP